MSFISLSIVLVWRCKYIFVWRTEFSLSSAGLWWGCLLAVVAIVCLPNLVKYNDIHTCLDWKDWLIQWNGWALENYLYWYKAAQEPLPLPPATETEKCDNSACCYLKRKRERNSHCTTSALDKAQPYNAVTPTQNVGAYACRLRVVLINLSRIEVRVQQQKRFIFPKMFYRFSLRMLQI